MRVPILIDRTAPAPIHRQIYDEWRQAVLSGRLRPGERVPSTREFAVALTVSRATVTAAYDQLSAEGYLLSVQGSGTFVCAELPDDLLRPGGTPRPRRDEQPAVRVSAYGSRLRADFWRSDDEPGVIDLSRGGPDLGHFPVGLWRRVVARHLRFATSAGFDYGRQVAGYEPLRREVASYLARSRAVRCSPEQVIVVNGSQQALDLTARVLLDVGDEVAIENPGYTGARHLFAAHGARLAPVRVTASGIAVEDLKPSTRLVYLTPSHQFPTGVSLPLARRLDLVEWARPHGAVIVEDDYDSEYRYAGAPLPSLQSLADGVPVVYVGTFSNVMFPGLRVGYVVVPPDLVAPFTRAKWLSDRQTPVLEQAALADFLLEGHLERHIRRMRRLYKRRYDVLIEALASGFGGRAAVRGDAAGMHVLVAFDRDGMVARAARHGVRLMSSAPYYLSGAPRNEVVMGFSAVGERTIRKGVKRLAMSAR